MDMTVALAATRDMLAEHGLTGWRAVASNGKNTLGSCNYTTKTIKLSRSYVALNGYTEVRLTIHEIAHALTPGAKHGWKWRAKARELGVPNPKATCSNPDVKVAEHRYHATCPGCPEGKVFARRHVLLPAAMLWRSRCHKVTIVWHDRLTGRNNLLPEERIPVAARRVGETPLDLDYSSMTPGQKAAHTKRVRKLAAQQWNP